MNHCTRPKRSFCHKLNFLKNVWTRKAGYDFGIAVIVVTVNVITEFIRKSISNLKLNSWLIIPKLNKYDIVSIFGTIKISVWDTWHSVDLIRLRIKTKNVATLTLLQCLTSQSSSRKRCQNSNVKTKNGKRRQKVYKLTLFCRRI